MKGPTRALQSLVQYQDRMFISNNLNFDMRNWNDPE